MELMELMELMAPDEDLLGNGAWHYRSRPSLFLLPIFQSSNLFLLIGLSTIHG